MDIKLINDFVDKHLGENVDFDGFYAGQCVDLFREYVRSVLKNPQPKGVVGAKDLWTNYESDSNLNVFFTKIPYKKDVVLQAGDVVLWGEPVGKYFDEKTKKYKYAGHVAIYIKKNDQNADKFTSFDENWPTLSKCTLTEHSLTSPAILGVLRPIPATNNQPINDWKDYFRFDVTKKLSNEIFLGLNLNKAIGFERNTALDSIVDVWNKMIQDKKSEFEATVDKYEMLLQEKETTLENLSLKIAKLEQDIESLSKPVAEDISLTPEVIQENNLLIAKLISFLRKIFNG